MTDAEMAMAMQLAEVEQQQEDLRHGRQLADRRVRLVDPLWGEYTRSDGKEPYPWERCGFALCPCAMIGCKASAKRSWRNFLLSWAVASAMVQVAMLVVAILAFDGFVPLHDNPMLGPHYYALDELGAKNVARIMLSDEWWRLLTPMLLHTGVLHLLGNLLVQLRTGAQLEYMWGHTSFFFIYIVSGVYATLCSCVMLPGALSVGSSGALCGLFGAWFSFMIITWNQTLPHDIPERNQQVLSISFSILLVGGLSFLPLMDFGAHLGGMAAGATLAMPIFADRLQHEGYRWATRVIGILLAVGLFLALVGWLFFATEVDENLLRICKPGDQC